MATWPIDRFLHTQIISKSRSSLLPRSWALLTHSQHSGVQCGWDQHLFPLWDGEEKKKLQTLFIFIHGRFAPLFTKEGDRSTKLCSSFNLFSPKTKEKYLFDHCLFHSSGYNWGWGCRWGVRSEDEFLGSYSWVIAYQSILLSRTGRGRLLALMVSHVIFRITETLLTHMRNAEAVWGCIIKSVLMTSLYCSCVSMGASLGQVGEDRFPLIHIHRTGFVKMMRCVFCLKTHSLPILPFSRDSVQFSCSVMSSSLQPYGIQHIRLPCPTPTPRAYSNSCTSSQWCHPASSSSAITFSSCPQSFPASGSFQMSQLFTSGGQSTGVSASASVLPMNIQDWFPLGWTDWISLQSKGLLRVFSNTTVQKHQFFGTQLSLESTSHIHTWLLEKP